MTMLRDQEHKVLRAILLSGEVLDLGGDARSTYAVTLGEGAHVTTVNISQETGADIIADLEKPLPLKDSSYDGVMLMNVLEHVFEYRALLSECARVLKSGGKVAIVVPYMFPYHASPSDYHRYSKEALTRALRAAGFTVDMVTPLGSGVFAARWLFIERLLPGKFQNVLAPLTHTWMRMADGLFTKLARALKKRYDPSDYALGFCVTAHK